MTALSSLSFSLQSNPNWQAQENLGSLGNTLVNRQNPTKLVSLGSVAGSPANNTAGGADELYANTLTISASGTATINLTSFTDACNQTSVSLSRVKAWRFWLLSSSDSSLGNACTGITVGNAGSNPFLFNWGGTTPTQSLGNGEFFEWATPNAAGIAVSGSHENILITNTDSVNAAVVQVVICGGSS